MTGMKQIAAERLRQVGVEGWTPEHDDQHFNGELAEAAACYAQDAGERGAIVPESWPWVAEMWKPKDRRSDLVRAGALYLAEAERYERMGADAVASGFRDHARDIAALIDSADEDRNNLADACDNFTPYEPPRHGAWCGRCGRYWEAHTARRTRTASTGPFVRDDLDNDDPAVRLVNAVYHFRQAFHRLSSDDRRAVLRVLRGTEAEQRLREMISELQEIETWADGPDELEDAQ